MGDQEIEMHGRQSASVLPSVLRWTFVFAGILLVSCAGTRARPPGDRLIDPPAEVWEDYRCDRKVRPFLVLERNQVSPRKIRPGGEFNHRLIYAMCPVEPSQVISGDLYRRIYYKGGVVFEDIVRGFEVRPGKWSVDAFITIPEKAELGPYSVEATFTAGRVHFQSRQDLTVGE
jgi:hypothetical protein